MNISENLKKARKAKGLTQKELAELVGAKHNSVSGWESGLHKPDADTLELICGVLDISPSELFGIETPDRVIDSIKNTLSSLPSAPETISKTFPNLTIEEWEHIKTIRQLNDEGKERVFTYATDLQSTGRYAKKNNDNPLVDKA